jgi:N,N'-diacetylchitobiose transport system permease protein
VRAVETRPSSSSRRRAAAPPRKPPARRPGDRSRRLRHLVPYALLAPALLVLAAVLGFPMYRLVSLSFQQYGLKELFAGRGTFIGLKNYRDILADPFFWTVVARTVVFAAVCVGLTPSGSGCSTSSSAWSTGC